MIPFQSFWGDLWLCFADKQFMWLINPRGISQARDREDWLCLRCHSFLRILRTADGGRHPQLIQPRASPTLRRPTASHTLQLLLRVLQMPLTQFLHRQLLSTALIQWLLIYCPVWNIRIHSC